MMTESQPFETAVKKDAVNICGLSSVTSQQADTLVYIMRDVEPAWDDRTFDDYDEYLSFLIIPVARRMNTGPSSSQAQYSVSSCWKLIGILWFHWPN